MPWPTALKLKKSAGVPVSLRTSYFITEGNKARSGKYFTVAAEYYRKALKEDPGLYHIWIQLGHMYKDGEKPDLARRAYRKAAELRPASGEPNFMLGQVERGAGRLRAAASHLLRALQAPDYEADAARDLDAILGNVAMIGRDLLRRVAHRIVVDTERTEPVEVAGSGAAPGATRPLVLDLTDLVGHFRHQRLPTGIQRVQIEVALQAIERIAPADLRLCCYVHGRDRFVGIEPALLVRLAHHAVAGTAEAWEEIRVELILKLTVDPEFEFIDDCVLLNLGTSWWVYDYFRLIRDAKDRHRIKYVPYVHDLIPIVAPEHCVRGVSEDFTSWLVGVFYHADLFLANSQSTKADLVRTARRCGHEVADDRVRVVPLDADFRRPTIDLPEDRLTDWGLHKDGFALLVSTIESRKNHLLAFQAWSELVRRRGLDGVPPLVCVGRNGWLNEPALAFLRSDPLAARKVMIIDRVNDAELALLYRDCCFSLYPSHYEGWGLPITEALCWGRVPVIADNSSLPEAGQSLALTFESNSRDALVRVVERLIADPAWRHRQQDEIAKRFRARSWSAIADDVLAAIATLSLDAGDTAIAAPIVRRGRYHPTHLHKETRLWTGVASGEVYCRGDGWLWPDTGGCRLAPAGGALVFTVADAPRPLRLYIRVRGLASRACGFEVTCGERIVVAGRLAAGVERWAAGDLPAIDGPVRLSVRSDASEPVELWSGGLLKSHLSSITILGFAVCAVADEDERSRFLSAVIGNLDGIDAFGRFRYDIAAALDGPVRIAKESKA